MPEQLELFTTIKPQTKEQLALDYKCSARTISRRCQEIGIHTKRPLNTREVKEYYNYYGPPEEVYEDWK